jgi:hypothetical protein
MKLRGIFEGTFESVWSMEVPDQLWNLYLLHNPDFDENDRDDIQEMWDYFKSQGCYDEVDDTADTDVYMTGIETYGVNVDVNE